MIKFIVKTVIVLLALQSAMDYLRQEEIIEGSIRINYPMFKQKLIAAVPTRKIVSGMAQVVARTVQHAASVEFGRGENLTSKTSAFEKQPAYKIVYHVVAEGESLAELAQRYQVHWRVIQKANQMADDEPLFVGQVLKIPSRIKKLDNYTI